MQNDGTVTSDASLLSAHAAEINTQIEAPTPELRFFDGVLQQRWEIQTLVAGSAKWIDREWRDVPHVDVEKSAE